MRYLIKLAYLLATNTYGSPRKYYRSMRGYHKGKTCPTLREAVEKEYADMLSVKARVYRKQVRGYTPPMGYIKGVR